MIGILDQFSDRLKDNSAAEICRNWKLSVYIQGESE